MVYLMLIALALWAAPLYAQNVEEPLSLETVDGQLIEGHIDWSKKTVVVYGDAVAPDHITHPVQRRLMGFRGAKAVAYRNLLEMVGQVQVDAETRVQNFMVENDSISVRVRGIVRGARVLPGSQSESPEGLYRLALELPLLGHFSAAVLPTSPLAEPAAIAYALPGPPAEPDSLSALPDAPPAVYVPPKPYTGLLIDARGLIIQPSMIPRIVAKDGRTIYSAASADSNYVAQFGLVGYGKDMGNALYSDRLGGEEANVFVVKAAGVSGLYSSDVVLDNFDATLVLMADVDGDFLRECRVTFLLGPAPVAIDSTFIDSLYIDTSYIGTNYIDTPTEGDSIEFPEQTETSDSTE